MKIGIVPLNVGLTDPQKLVSIAQKAESVGVESAWTFEHAIVPVHYSSTYPYHGSGKMPATPETPFLDPLITLSHLAAATKTLRLGTGVNILPQANPLMVAKQVASIDVLSQGRMMYGVGVGWLREEYDAMGVPFERRGARFNDYLAAIKKVWTGEVVEHDSDFIKWSGFKSYPTPVQKPHPPLIIGGVTPAAIRRVIAHGDGWFALGDSFDQLEQTVGEFRDACRAGGRNPDEVEITTMWFYAKEGRDSLSRYRDLGVTRLVIPLQQLGDKNPMVGLEKLGDAVLSG